MIRVDGWDGLPGDGRARFAALGTFDGVHRGHRALVERMVREARAEGALAAVCTFDPHPRAVLFPDSAPPLLTTVDERQELLAALGVDALVVRRFDRALAAVPAEEYVRRELCAEARLRRVYVGANFTFGQGGKGRPDDIARWGGEACGLAVRGEPIAGGGHWSATAAREAIAGGDLARAAEVLGRPYAVRGRVAHGDGRGRTLGFPTANVPVPKSKAMPPPGIYAGRATIARGRSHAAAISWGRRPTFGGGELLLEAHLLDFEGDLYGREISVEFRTWIRDEERFSDVDALVRRMEADVRRVREVAGSG